MTQQERLPIALDAMGGDNAPVSVIEGAVIARRKFPDLTYLFYGDEAVIAPLLEQHPTLKSASRIVHAPDKVAGDMKPSVALRQGKNSSMQLAINAVKNGEAQAAVSAGNTGALMAMAKLSLRMLPGINRPAIASAFPVYGDTVLMLDLGANLECSAEDLYQFAIMGDAYARGVQGKNNPSIGLLNVGSEETKGHPEIREAGTLIRNSGLKLNFQGFVEGTTILNGVVDVVVSDGFGGNIMLKASEGMARLISHYLKDSFNTNIWTKISYLIASKTMAGLKKKLDPRAHNGAMFLGLNGIVVKSHGSADGYAFYHAIKVAHGLVRNRTNDRIIAELKESGISEKSDRPVRAVESAAG